MSAPKKPKTKKPAVDPATGKKFPPNFRYRTPEARQALCKAWCDHLIKGFTRESFPKCDPQTFRKYAKEYPEDFDMEIIAEAERSQLLAWEARLANSAVNGKGAPAAIIYGLKNIGGRLGLWRDTVTQEVHPETIDSLAALLERIDGKTTGLPNGKK